MKYIIMILLVMVAIKLFRKPNEGGAVSTEQKAVDTVQDPITGTFVSKDTSYKVKYYDKVYYFGSKESMNKFIEQKKEEQA